METVPVTPSRRGIHGVARRAVAMLAVALILVIGAVPAQAAAPSASVTVTTGTFSASIAYRINRGATSITGQQCWLTVPSGVKSATACDPTPNPTSTSSTTRYSLTLPLLKKAGQYTFAVRFSLVGGTKASASKAFTIAPGPAVKLSVTNVSDQDFDCTADSYCGGGTTFGPDFPRQLAKVTARDQYGNVAKGYTGTVSMERRGGDFPDGIYPNDAKLNKGVGYFPFLAPQMPGAAFSTECPATNVNFDVLVRFYDKDDPDIHGCKKIQIRYLITPPTENFPFTTTTECPSGCYHTTDGFGIDSGTALKAYPIDSTDPADNDTFLIVGKLVDGDWFSQVTEINPLTVTVDGGDQGLPLATCPDCPGSRVRVEISSTMIDRTTELVIGGLETFSMAGNVIDPLTGKPTVAVVDTQRRRLCAETRAGVKQTVLSVLLTPSLAKCLGFADGTPPTPTVTRR